MARSSAAQRAKSSIVAEREIMRFALPDPSTGLKPHALWHKHVHNVELDPIQLLKMQEMDEHPNTVDFSCRRTGKTAVKEMYHLEGLATTPMQELGIVAPRMQQSQNNLDYLIDGVRRSEILSAFISYKQGRPQLKDTAFQFANGSKASAYGIMSQIDGDSITMASLEETDDMPQDRLLSRFLPMLGAARRLGVDRTGVEFKPTIRISGVYKGADVLQRLIDTGEYHTLPTVDVHLGVALGMVDANWAKSMQKQLPPEEYIRQFLCKNIRARNWIWEEHLRRASALGLEAGLQRACPMPGERYKRRGLISLGYDHTGHGEDPAASKSALVICEQIGNWATFPYVKIWQPGVSDTTLAEDLVSIWDYFRPDYAIGDAYGVGMMTGVNDVLYRKGLTHVNRAVVEDGQSNASAWSQWAFAPMRFEGMTKHIMASALREVFHNNRAAFPYVDMANDKEPEEWLAFVRQMGNMKATPTQASYSSFSMVDRKTGDDLFDAACAAVYALLTRGMADAPTVIQSRKQTREQLLGLPSVLARLADAVHSFGQHWRPSGGGVLVPA
ncbi:NDRG family protein [Acidovorax sp. sif1233]|uniref:NDRG family protein n=1 Tax=Acidovorax sp. sif1233 TaxID=2854792 RepID=UPI001C44E94B|nr:NDRG family protein [Acidovorax sp. sif1233]MBV7454290.1 NDRG family protein [Acidovorax sp. sif1233]